MGPPGKTAQIIGSFTNRTIAELPPDGYIPADWDAPGVPPLGNQMANGQGMLYSPTQEVCLWVGPTLTPSGWVELGQVAGPSGPQGAAGPAGEQGLQGIQGVAGPQGAQGPAGPAGAQGTPGTPGAAGAQGIKGDPGIPGTPGATGSQGPQGPAGAQGAKGDTGPGGMVGPAGPSAVSANAGNLAKLGTDNLLMVSNTSVLNGVTDGSNAAAGQIGEYISANNTAGSALTTGVGAQRRDIEFASRRLGRVGSDHLRRRSQHDPDRTGVRYVACIGDGADACAACCWNGSDVAGLRDHDQGSEPDHADGAGSVQFQRCTDHLPGGAGDLQRWDVERDWLHFSATGTVSNKEPRRHVPSSRNRRKTRRQSWSGTRGIGVHSKDTT